MHGGPGGRSDAVCRLSLAAMLLVAAPVFGATDPGAAQAPRMEFKPLPAGSYELQRIQAVRDASLLDERGSLVRLAAASRGKVTLLTFFYTYCVDPLGCPFAHTTLSKLRDRLIKDPRVANGVRFLSISLDPDHDTPRALRDYGAGFIGDAHFDWRFLTARSVPELLPVLNDLGQDVSVEVDDRGRPTRTLHHMLKMFLVDRDGVVREIYTLAYLQAEVMFNDIETLLLERAPQRAGGQRGDARGDQSPADPVQ